MLVRLCSKSFKLGFSSVWTESSQMYKLGFEEAEESEIKLLTFVGSWRKPGNSRKTSTSASLTTQKTLCGSQQTVENSSRGGNTCLLRNVYAGQEAKVRTGHGTIDWFQIGKGVSQGCILSPRLFNLYAEYIMRNSGLDEAQAGIQFAGRNISNLTYTNDITLMAESKKRTKGPLNESERGEWKSWLKTQHSEN